MYEVAPRVPRKQISKYILPIIHEGVDLMACAADEMKHVLGILLRWASIHVALQDCFIVCNQFKAFTFSPHACAKASKMSEMFMSIKCKR